MKFIEKIASWVLVVGLVGLLMVGVLPEPTSGQTVTVSATVSSSMVSCTTANSAISFPTLDNTVIATSTTDATTTIQSSGAVVMTAYDSGDEATYPGLYKNPDLIESPWATTTDATGTIEAGQEGFGMQATNSSGTNVLVEWRYDFATSIAVSQDVGGIMYSAGNASTVASSAAAITETEVIDITFVAAASITTPGGGYSDGITLSCTAS
ncbi:MAG: hypothetical protein ABH831_00735 [Candidatus Nealsonbacteria bacterium]